MLHAVPAGNWQTKLPAAEERIPRHRRLANGNVLITAGSVSANDGDARVFEVTKADGKVVWEFRMPPGIGVYRADRITPPLVADRSDKRVFCSLLLATPASDHLGF